MTNVLLIYLVNLLMESSMSTIHNSSSSKNVKIAVVYSQHKRYISFFGD